VSPTQQLTLHQLEMLHAMEDIKQAENVAVIQLSDF
jgi:hypothetical protein